MRQAGIAAITIGISIATSAMAHAERWPEGKIDFELPEGAAESRKVEALPNGLKRVSFAVELDGGECRITLAPALNMERLLADNPGLAPEHRMQVEQMVDSMRQLETLEEAERNKALQAMALPLLSDIGSQKGYRERAFEAYDASYSAAGVPLGTLEWRGEGENGPVVLWASASFVAMTSHVTVFEAPEAEAEACGGIMESMLASFAASER